MQRLGALFVSARRRRCPAATGPCDCAFLPFAASDDGIKQADGTLPGKTAMPQAGRSGPGDRGLRSEAPGQPPKDQFGR